MLSHESMPTESRYGLPVNRRSRAILERIEVVRAELRPRIAHVYPARRRPARPMASAMPGSSANVFGKSRSIDGRSVAYQYLSRPELHSLVVE
jgi:hypothetical protein